MLVINKVLPVEFRDDISTAVAILKKAGWAEIYIFGSLARGDEDALSDIDFAVKGLPKSSFFGIGGQLMLNLKHRFDLVELDDEENSFSRFILENEVFVNVA